MNQQPLYTSLEDLVELSMYAKHTVPVGTINHEGEVDCSFTLEVDPDVYNDMPRQAYCYSASVTRGDILLITDKGTFTYLVDYVGDDILGAELFDWGNPVSTLADVIGQALNSIWHVEVYAVPFKEWSHGIHSLLD